MTNSDASTHSLPTRMIAGLCSLSLLITPAWGAETKIADTPLGIGIDIPPAMIFALDDSGSMDGEVLLPTNDGALWWNTVDKKFTGRDLNDLATTANVFSFNKSGSISTTWRKYIYLFPNGANPAGKQQGRRFYQDNPSDFNSSRAHYALPPTKEFAWARSSAYNPLYYDTQKTYAPWKPAHDGTALKKFSNVTDYSKVRSHPLYPLTGASSSSGKPDTAFGSFNLTENFNFVNQEDGWRYIMYPGMTLPGGNIARYKPGSCSIAPNVNASWSCPLATDMVLTEAKEVQITYYPATFYVPEAGATDGLKPDGTSGLKKYEIKPGNTFPSKRSYEDEIQNFANWYAYYRKRHMMLNSAIGAVLGDLSGIRTSVVYFNNRQPVTLFDLTTTSPDNSKKLVYQFYSRLPEAIGKDGTPTRDTLKYIGDQFRRTDGDTPIKYECQFNAAFVVTDGFANVADVGVGEIDSNDSNSNNFNRQYSSSGWTTLKYPYTDGSKPTGNTLADIAMYYYANNLRPDLPAGKVPVKSDDVSPNADRNNALHMNTYALGLGAAGTIFGVDTAKTANPFATSFDWPSPNQDRSPLSVDDLWHATINGRGKMLSSTDVDSTRLAIESIVSDILSKSNSSAAAAVSNPRLTASDGKVYASSFDATNWTGSLSAWAINTSTGAIDKTDQWNPSAKTQLKTRSADDPTAENRIVITYNGKTAGVPFRFADLNDTQKAKLDNFPGMPESDAEDVVNYLRGDRTNESDPDDDAKKTLPYRHRVSLLGDIVHAQAGLLLPPNEEYSDAGYAAFVVARQSRKKLVLQGSNDGMLHAFNASNTSSAGAEEWAYIPHRVIDQGLLPALTKKSGFIHHYYADGTPTIADVDFFKTTGATATAPDWRTLFIGSLQKGGRGFYAIDVTKPESMTTEATVAEKVLWEFPRDDQALIASKVGYSFGRPVVAKLPDGNWYVLVSSGYNNGSTTGGDGKGWLFVLNPRNGNVVYQFSTGVGSAADPSGLAYIAAFKSKGSTDATARYVYGGDLKGNVWRFDLLKPTDASSVGPVKLATLVDKEGNPQPITTAPQIANVEVKSGGGKQPFVFYATGRYLDSSDVDDTSQTQTVYGLLDDLTATEITPLRGTDGKLVEQTFTTPSGPEGSKTRNLSTNPVNYDGATPKRGWYVDLNITGERVTVDPALTFGVLAVGSNIPSNDVCLPGGSGYLTYFDFKTGGKVKGSMASSFQLGTSMIVGLMFIQTADGKIKIMLTDSKSNIPIFDSPIVGGATGIRRATWKELVQR